VRNHLFPRHHHRPAAPGQAAKRLGRRYPRMACSAGRGIASLPLAISSHEPWVGLGILTEPIRPLMNAHRRRGTRRPTKHERFKVPMRDLVIVGATQECAQPAMLKQASSSSFAISGLGCPWTPGSQRAAQFSQTTCLAPVPADTLRIRRLKTDVIDRNWSQ
jgi:hypothetical protein